MVISYYAECQNCFAENQLPLTNQDIPRTQVKESIFECGNCGARLGENNGEHRKGTEFASRDTIIE
jgi:hypothetical protein